MQASVSSEADLDFDSETEGDTAFATPMPPGLHSRASATPTTPQSAETAQSPSEQLSSDAVGLPFAGDDVIQG